ncbi:hypothetical protein F2Q69_00054559 [Brassica cretica]|uniref:HTH araC/xylS-type domain-containing protein n=1 Tax=Brassica cretica TaxID=69181 RepID=A0A8S9N0V0_BRACR|nr:hypothetical protein F2Q69_00054559 [Brassica cretica]
MTHSFLERIGQPEVDLANDREESVPFNVHDATSILEFSSSQMFSKLFRDSFGTTETERNALPTSNSKNINYSTTSLLSWPSFGCCKYCGFRDPCFNLSVIGFMKMNKHLVKNFLAFRNSQGRSRDAKDDQEDSQGDEVSATDQGAGGRMVRP